MGLRITVDRMALVVNSALVGTIELGEIALVRLWSGCELLDQLTLEQFEQLYGFRAANDLLRR